MALTLDELNSIRYINDAWTRYLKPTIDEIIKLIDLDPNTVMPNESDISRFTSIIEHLYIFFLSKFIKFLYTN